MELTPATYLQIDLNALVANYRFFKKTLGTTKIMAVVKAFAYGHEAIAIAKELEKENIAYFAVAYTAEGIRLREAHITSPILVLHPQPSEVAALVHYNLEPTLYNNRMLTAFQTYLKEPFTVHIKFNTGLNRLGFDPSDAKELGRLLNTSPFLQVASIFSHLAASEDPQERVFTQTQINTYKTIVSDFQKEYKHPFIKHIANTSGALNYPEARFDMVRIGIGLYGYANDEKWTKQLQNVGSLYSIISQKHNLNKGESVGYNRAFIADKKMQTATIPIGHADGIPRTWGKGKGFVSIHNQKAPVLGNVCMDMIMVDVTGISCQEGDRVVVFDSQVTVEDLAKNTQTISYELLTAISQRVKRKIVGL